MPRMLPADSRVVPSSQKKCSGTYGGEMTSDGSGWEGRNECVVVCGLRRSGGVVSSRAVCVWILVVILLFQFFSACFFFLFSFFLVIFGGSLR